MDIRVTNHPHSLVMTNNRSGWRCDACGKHGTTTMASYRCTPCNFDLCFDCGDRYQIKAGMAQVQPVQPTCFVPPHGGHHHHQPPPIVVVQQQQPPPQQPYYPPGPYGMGVQMQPQVQMQMPMMQMQMQPQMQMHMQPQMGMQMQYTSSPVSVAVSPACYEAVMPTIGEWVSTHPHELQVTFNTRGWSCDNCSNHYEAENAAYRCSACNYDICFFCFSNLQMPMVRHHHHRLTPIAYNPSLSWTCDVCNANRPPGVRFHCSQNCNFDLCTSCALGFRGRYGYIVHSSGMVLDARGGSRAARTELILWPKNYPPSNNQLWRFDGAVIRSRMDERMVVDVKGGDNSGPGSVTQLFSYHGKHNQQWHMEGPAIVSGHVTKEFSGFTFTTGGGFLGLAATFSPLTSRALVLDVENGYSPVQGARVVVNNQNGGASQQWRFEAVV